MSDEAIRSEAKMELMEISSGLMPAGQPAYLSIIRYPKISELIELEGKKNIRIAIFFLVKNFCDSINVVRNMNEDQMIECAQVLIDECGNFRLEDYVMMFSLAKRGQLVKILDRIDVQVIITMLDAYWQKRHEAGKRQDECDTDGYNHQGNNIPRSTVEDANQAKDLIRRANLDYLASKPPAKSA